MKRDQIQAVMFCVALGVILAALINKSDGKNNALPANPNPGNLQQVAGRGGWNQPGFAYGPNYAVQAALTQAPPIMAGQMPPELIKYMGIEVIEVGSGKIKITGVMGGSWADKAGLQADDIIVRFNNKKIESLEDFKTMVAAAPPEKDYPVKYLRNGALKKTMVTIGEGEMEGFLPIQRNTPAVAAVPVAFGNSMGGQQGAWMPGQGLGGGMCVYRCPQCGNTMEGAVSSDGTSGPICPICRIRTQRIL